MSSFSWAPQNRPMYGSTRVHFEEVIGERVGSYGQECGLGVEH